MLQKSEKTIVTGLLLILLPPLFIVAGGIPAMSELFGYGEGFAYMLAYIMLLCIFLGMVLVLIGLFKKFSRRG